MDHLTSWPSYPATPASRKHWHYVPVFADGGRIKGHFYGVVGTVAGDGAPRSLSDFRSSRFCWTRLFSFSDSSLVGLVKQGGGSPSREEGRARNGQELALRTALNGRPRAWDGDEIAVGGGGHSDALITAHK